MQEQDPVIEEARRHPLVSFLKSQEEEVPPAEIDSRWDGVVSRMEHETSLRKRTVRRLYAKVACVAALVAGLCWGVSLVINHRMPSIEHAIARLEHYSVDTARQVWLISPAGKHIQAGRKAHIVYTDKGEASVNRQQRVEAPQKMEYNQLIVPKGRSSHLVLADGTSIYVNAGTKMVYPSLFTDKIREIYVDGEIYIDVAKHAEQPFVVRTPDFNIRVTGTAFNVRAYKSMDEAEVVLVRGSILVTDHAEREVAVKPNELLLLTNGVAGSKRIVDTSEYTAWTEGHFPLQGRGMLDILQRLSLYYGCELTCDSVVGTLSLQGTIDISVPLPRLLERIAKLYPIGYRKTGSGGYHLFIIPNTNP